MKIKLEFITGFLIGFELISEYCAAFIDLGIIRIYFDWAGEDET
jgi:hypothetical protein